MSLPKSKVCISVGWLRSPVSSSFTAGPLAVLSSILPSPVTSALFISPLPIPLIVKPLKNPEGLLYISTTSVSTS